MSEIEGLVAKFLRLHCRCEVRQLALKDLHEIILSARRDEKKKERVNDTELLDFAEGLGCELKVTVKTNNRVLRKQLRGFYAFLKRNSDDGNSNKGDGTESNLG